MHSDEISGFFFLSISTVLFSKSCAHRWSMLSPNVAINFENKSSHSNQLRQVYKRHRFEVAGETIMNELFSEQSWSQANRKALQAITAMNRNSREANSIWISGCTREEIIPRLANNNKIKHNLCHYRQANWTYRSYSWVLYKVDWTLSIPGYSVERQWTCIRTETNSRSLFRIDSHFTEIAQYIYDKRFCK